PHATDPPTGVVTYDDLIKPDLVAPGHRIISLERDKNLIVTVFPALHVDTGNNVNNKSRYMILYGTSMSAGVVSGAAALMLQASPGLTPRVVKAGLTYSAQSMEGPNLFEQGSGMLNVEGAVRLARSLSPYAYALAPGRPLAPGGLPAPQSTIAGESCAWSQSLIWGGGALTGSALFTTQQAAYSQTLIWGFDAASWGAGVTYTGGLFSDSYVVFGKGGQWVYLTPGPGSALSSGLIWCDAQYATGAAWQNQVISNDFFNVGSTSLIWGFSGYELTDQSLIWGFRLFSLSLIWGF